MQSPFIVIGNLDSRRVALFQAALTQLGLPPAHLVAYADLLAGRVVLPDVVPPGAVVRIESPGKNWEVERALLLAGANLPDDEPCDCIDADAVQRLCFERGRILYVRQWYRGLCATLRMIAQQLAVCPPHALINAPDEIVTMFDKRATHARLHEAGVPVPRGLGQIRSYADLVVAMRAADCPRVFVKLAHGSSASGAVAYQTNGRAHHASTTVEMVRDGGELRLYNSRRLRVYRDPNEIAVLIDALCRHCVHVEQWVPKASVGGQAFDLRVVVIGGQVRHVIVRQSRSPMTNLHLLNERGDVAAVQAKMGAAAWATAMQTCEQTMVYFPRSLYAGVDLLIGTDHRHHAVLEVNAWGDLLPGVLHEGMDTYAAEISAILDTCGSYAGAEGHPDLL